MNWKHLATLSGIVWLVIGFFLTKLGTGFLMLGFAGADLGIVVTLCMLLGALKGRLLQKSATKQVARLRALKGPIRPWQIYSGPYYLLLGAMMGMGMLFNFLGISPMVRGFIDVTVGFALLCGSIAYFKGAFSFDPA